MRVLGKGADQIDEQGVGGPVAATDYVPGSCTGQFHTMLRQAIRGEERVPVGPDRQLGRPLAAAVGIPFAHGIVFPISPDLLAVFIALVARNGDDGAGASQAANGIQHVDRAHHVHVEGLTRVLITFADDRLGSEVQDEIRIGLAHGFGQASRIANIRDKMVYQARLDTCHREVVRLCGGIEGVAGHLGAEPLEPKAEPRAFESGVPGDKHGSSLEDSAEGDRQWCFRICGSWSFRHGWVLRDAEVSIRPFRLPIAQGFDLPEPLAVVGIHAGSAKHTSQRFRPFAELQEILRPRRRGSADAGSHRSDGERLCGRNRQRG